MQTNLLFYVALLSAARHRRRSNWVRMWNVDGIYVCFVVVVRWVEFACRSPWRSTSSGGCCHLAHETIGLLCMCWVFGQMRDELHARQLFTFFSVIRYLGWKKFPKLFPLPTTHTHTRAQAATESVLSKSVCFIIVTFSLSGHRNYTKLCLNGRWTVDGVALPRPFLNQAYLALGFCRATTHAKSIELQQRRHTHNTNTRDLCVWNIFSLGIPQTKIATEKSSKSNSNRIKQAPMGNVKTKAIPVDIIQGS